MVVRFDAALRGVPAARFAAGAAARLRAAAVRGAGTGGSPVDGPSGVWSVGTVDWSRVSPCMPSSCPRSAAALPAGDAGRVPGGLLGEEGRAAGVGAAPPGPPTPPARPPQRRPQRRTRVTRRTSLGARPRMTQLTGKRPAGEQGHAKTRLLGPNGLKEVRARRTGTAPAGGSGRRPTDRAPVAPTTLLHPRIPGKGYGRVGARFQPVCSDGTGTRYTSVLRSSHPTARPFPACAPRAPVFATTRPKRSQRCSERVWRPQVDALSGPHPGLRFKS